jgi:IS1 family transposase/transposase-like protein
MSSEWWLEHLPWVLLMGFLLHYLWQRLYIQTEQKKKKKEQKGPPRKPRPKSPKDCPACNEGLCLSIFHPKEVVPWSEVKSRRGRKKRIETQGFACPNPECDYFGITDTEVHALVGNGKGGKDKSIQQFRCQACTCAFTSRRNTPLYYLKTDPDRVGMCLWLAVEGVDISVLVRFTGHVDATIARWLTRAGQHSARLHNQLFTDLTPDCIQVDELSAPIVGDRKNWLWLSIDPATKIVPAFHLGRRTTQEAMVFIHLLTFTLAPGWVPIFLSDGINQYFYALTAHFGCWKYPAKQWVWLVSPKLLYAQLVKRRGKRRHDGKPFAYTRMMWGRYLDLVLGLYQAGLSLVIQTAFIERINLTIRPGIAALRRRTWAKAHSNEVLALHIHLWLAYYHLARPHESLSVRVPGFRRRYRQRSPAMVAGLTDHLWTVGDILHMPLVSQGGAA